MTDYICPFCGKTYSGEDGRLDAQVHVFLSPCGTFSMGSHYLDTPLVGYEGWTSGARDEILPNTQEWWYSLLLGLSDSKEDKKKLREFMNSLLHALMSFGTKPEDIRHGFEEAFAEPFKSKFKDGYYGPNKKYEEKLVEQHKEYEKDYQAIIERWRQSQV